MGGKTAQRVGKGKFSENLKRGYEKSDEQEVEKSS